MAFLLLSVPFIVIALTGYLLSAPKYHGPETDHFNGRRFFTPGGKPAKSLIQVFKWLRTREKTPWMKVHVEEQGERPPAKFQKGTRITFINHSTFLIQVDGLNILTDPVWSNRVSPFSWAGPHRMRPPGINFDDLPRIDAILLSHNHYDHLDIKTLQRLYKRHHPTIITTLGVGRFLKAKKISGCIELDWWKKIPLNDSLDIQVVPAQHFSGRGLFDRDATLWCGFVIRRHGGNIYFAGDTGYNESIFKNIGYQCTPIEVALIPIGAYKPEWFMSPIHCSPEEAITIHLETRAKQSIASHFGTFPLADDGAEEPFDQLRKGLKKRSLPATEFIRLKEGESRNFG